MGTASTNIFAELQLARLRYKLQYVHTFVIERDYNIKKPFMSYFQLLKLLWIRLDVKSVHMYLVVT